MSSSNRFPFKGASKSAARLRELTTDDACYSQARDRYVFQVTSHVELDIDETSVGSWHDLTLSAHKTASAGIAARRKSIPARHFTIKEFKSVQREIRTDLRLGIGQITALLEVIPRVVDLDSASKDEAMGHYLRSASIMTGWRSLSQPGDLQLTKVLSRTPTPKRDGWREYDNLRYKPEYFDADPSGGIRIHPGRVNDLIFETGNFLTLDESTVSPEATGCPAAQLVPNLYRAMAQTAVSRELYLNLAD